MKCMCGCDVEMQVIETRPVEDMGFPFGLRSEVTYMFCPVCDCVCKYGKPYIPEVENVH